MVDIASIAQPLATAARERGFELVACSNSREEFEKCVRPLPVRSSYIEYDHGAFPELLSSATAVILPVGRNPFTLVKSHDRLTTALAAGIPAADGIPSYLEFPSFCVLDD